MVEVISKQAYIPRYLQNRPCLQIFDDDDDDNNDDDRRYNGSKEGRRRMDLLDIDINAVNDGYHQRKYRYINKTLA